MTALVTQQHDLARSLLADREQLSLSRATTYLVGRARTRTPLGAAEMLEMRANFGGREGHETRLHLATQTCALYAELFPREYAASQSPPFSLAREQEFYLLVNRKLFPLCLGGQATLDYESELERHIAQEPCFFMPFIPVVATQQHDWVRGCCGFDRIQTVFKLVLALIRHEGERGWQQLARLYELPASLRPAPLLAAYGWTHFLFYCRVEDSPLRFLPVVFHMITYKTGCVWLDVKPGAPVGAEWSGENIAKLLLHRLKGERINQQVLALDEWLDERPRERIIRAVELWNRAYEMEVQSGFEGMLVNDRGRLERPAVGAQ